MIWKLITVWLLLSGVALAEDRTLTVSEQDLAVLDRALGQMPYREAAPLIAKLQAQISEQAKKAEEKK